MEHAGVVVVADSGDRHGDRVKSAVEDMGTRTMRLTASLLPKMRAWNQPQEELVVVSNGVRWVLDSDSTIWWRRPGIALPDGLDDHERRLVIEEVGSLLPGMLAAIQVRWVDAPWTLLRARLKVLQLATAKRLGISIPESIVTGSRTAAERFARHGPVVAKAVSSGRGIAPHVQVVPVEELGRVEVCPTLLQRLVVADADTRIVTVGEDSFAWVRRRKPGEPPDWRTVDPAGNGFLAVNYDPSFGGANQMAKALGLSFSVQDWLITSDSITFLEVNAQGQWLFLKRADPVVVSALARHLIGSS